MAYPYDDLTKLSGPELADVLSDYAIAVHGATDAPLSLLESIRRLREDRAIWRQYACAAMGASDLRATYPGYEDAVSDVASKMLAREKELFG